MVESRSFRLIGRRRVGTSSRLYEIKSSPRSHSSSNIRQWGLPQSSGQMFAEVDIPRIEFSYIPTSDASAKASFICDRPTRWLGEYVIVTYLGG